MGKSTKIDFSEDRLLEMASAFVDDHDYMNALKMLQKNAEINCIDERTYMLYAEIYDDLGMHEECINNWFKYIDCAVEPDLAEAYEGLAVNFMQLDDDQFAAYYYNKLLLETGDMNDESRQEVIDYFLKREENPLRFASPPEKADYTADLNKGVDYIQKRQPEKAIKYFNRIPEGNEKYLLARNYIAMSYVLCDKPDKAEKECAAILEKDENNVQALTTLAAVCAEQKRTDEAKALAERLAGLDVSAPEDIYKIATVCCENKLHRQAYNLFCRLDEDVVNGDRNMLFFKAAAAYNCGEIDASLDIFDRLVTTFPDAIVAQHYYDMARENAGNEDREEMSYFYRLPKEMRESSLEFLSVLYNLSRTEAEKLCEKVDALGCIQWCFDETESFDENDLHYVAAMCAVKVGYDEFIRDLLLNAFISENLKLSVVRALGDRNEDNSFGVVLCNIYNTIDFYKLEIGRAKRKFFVGAYAILVSRFGIMDETYSAKFASATEKVYYSLEKNGALGLCKDSETLAAVILNETGVREAKPGKIDLCDYFNADKRRYDAISEALRKTDAGD